MNDQETKAAAERIIDKHSHATDDARTVAQAWSAEHPEDDAEMADPDWLIKVGVKGVNDEPGVDVYDIELGAGLVIRIVIKFCRGEMVGSSVSLHWEFRDGGGKVSLAYVIDDDPTRGDVRRLCSSLGRDLKEPH